jgi:hypothetical protein
MNDIYVKKKIVRQISGPKKGDKVSNLMHCIKRNFVARTTLGVVTTARVNDVSTRLGIITNVACTRYAKM